EPAEKAANAFVVASVALDDEPPLLRCEALPGSVERNVERACRALQGRELGPVVRPRPRLDGALPDRSRGVRHDEIHVELDDVAESMTRRAGAEGIVERKQARLRILVRDAAALALEPLAEHMARQRAAIVTPDLEGESGAATFRVRSLDRVGEARAKVAVDLHAIHDDRHHGPAGQGRAIE